MEKTTITLHDGTTYTPEKGKPPVCPCRNCKDLDSRKWGECNSGFGVCPGYMDYEHMNAVYKRTVF